MVKRVPLEKSRYVAAIVLTILVFSLGLLSGFLMDNKRFDYLAEEAQQQKLEYASLQLQHQLIEDLAREEECGALLKVFDYSVNNLEKLRVRLESFQESATFNKQDFDVLSREYSLAQIRYYLFAQRTKELCDNDISTALYFFASDDNCSSCDSQAFVLTYLKRLFEQKILVFSLNSELAFEEATIRVLMDTHNITQYPSVVLNEQVFDYLLTADEAKALICDQLQEPHRGCE